MKKVLLYSGGMDSWLMSKLWKPDIKLYVNMHTKYSENELKKMSNEILSGEVIVVDLSLGQWERDDAIIPLRNLYLCMVACNITDAEDTEILIGATAGDRVLDKSYDFVAKANDILNYLYNPQHWIPEGKKVKICIDYKDHTKADLLKEFKEKGGNLEEAFTKSFSCYNPVDGHECWSCKPCFRKFVSFSQVGYQFTDDIARTCCRYIRDEIVPQIESGCYGRGEQEEQDIMQAFDKYKHLITMN